MSLERGLVGEGVVVVDFEHEIGECLSLDELHDHRQVLVVLDAVVDADHVRVVAGPQDLALLPDHKEVLARKERLVDVLDCHL